MTNSPGFRLWTEGAWRCEYWITNGAGELRLYFKDAVQSTQYVEGGEAVLATSSEWQTMVRSGNQRPS